jgi:hypothetical protein
MALQASIPDRARRDDVLRESPGLEKPAHRNHATIAASFAERSSRELGTLVVVNQQQV